MYICVWCSPNVILCYQCTSKISAFDGPQCIWLPWTCSDCFYIFIQPPVIKDWKVIRQTNRILNMRIVFRTINLEPRDTTNRLLCPEMRCSARDLLQPPSVAACLLFFLHSVLYLMPSTYLLWTWAEIIGLSSINTSDPVPLAATYMPVPACLTDDMVWPVSIFVHTFLFPNSSTS